jgi:hypothetical protein
MNDLSTAATTTTPCLTIMIDTDGERICSIFAISNPDKLDAMAPAGAGEAVERP